MYKRKGMEYMGRWLIIVILCIFHVKEGYAQGLPKEIGKFIQKSSITLLGKVPTEEEVKIYTAIIEQNEDRVAARSKILDTMMSRKDFYANMEVQLREEYLEGISKKDFIEIYLKDFFFLRETRKASVHWLEIDNTFRNLFFIVNVMNGEHEGALSIREIQVALVGNYIYMQINMGVDNFVLSTYQHFIRRKPTKFELEEAKAMIGGSEAFLFNRKGTGQHDYLQILLNNPAYWEGQVFYWFNKINNRNPDIDEVMQYIGYMEQYKTPENLIKAILMDMN